MYNTYHIPLPVYLIKWAYLEFFEGQKAPFKVNDNTLLGKLVIATLLDPRSKEIVSEDWPHSFSL
ncbi:MAG: hypothetical protein ACKOE6_08515 [Flammeovirgaceae bacterium]